MNLCCFCNLKLKEIFIKCNQCRMTYICLECFSIGVEKEEHRNFHEYKLVNLRDILSFDSWDLFREMELLDKISKNECLVDDWWLHQEKWFDFFKPQTNFINEKKLYENRVKTTQCQLKEINLNDFNNLNMFNLTSIRPLVHSKQYRQMNGYKPARGDFETEYNDRFELKYLADLDFEFGVNRESLEEEIDVEEDTEEDYAIEDELKICILKSYNNLLKDREEKKVCT